MASFSANISSIPDQFDYMNNDDDREWDGTYRFDGDQFYEGQFLGDSFHGQGTYNWLNFGVYDGGFYSNCKEGYASLSFPDSSYFEGLFVENKPFGPGILTHPNGRQDAGFWKGSKLVRLSRAVDFIIPRLAPTSAAKIKLLQFRRLIPLDEDVLFTDEILKKYGHPLENFSAPFSRLIYDRRSTFFDKRAFEKVYFSAPKERSAELPKSLSVSATLTSDPGEEETVGEPVREPAEREVPAHCVCSGEVFVMRYETVASVDICETVAAVSSSEEEEMGILAYFAKYGTDGIEAGERESDTRVFPSEEALGDIMGGDKSKVPKIVSWNRNELCTEMLKQIFRFRDFEGKLNFSISKLMIGARTAFRKTGENEMQCLHFLKMCSLGPAHVVKGILCAQQISEELMDARGNNSLMFAAATDQHDVIAVLVNYGVDVNTFNDEGLTPLNLCLLRRLAQVNGVSSWETAFLPKEIDETKEIESQIEGFSFRGSIASLDRIFGDGMSMNESTLYGADSRTELSRVLSPRPLVAVESKPISRVKTDGSKTILPNASKIQGSLSIINWEWEYRSRRSSSVVALSNPTPTLNIKIIPKSVRRDEFERSLRKTSKDKYFFEYKMPKSPPASKPGDPSGSIGKRPSKKDEKQWENGDEDEDKDKVRDQDEDEEEGSMEDILSSSFGAAERIEEIDKTIALLLKMGADPNISEVPKPSIHLGLYTKNYRIVYNLLFHGADPDSPLHVNESRLTPLHVIAVQEPAPEYVEICDLLLTFKANPDIETLPGFLISGEEEDHLDPEHGRTPLQLICMRPDLEFGDPNGNLTKIALKLAKTCQTKRQYNGHSYLTLAMISGNIKLLESLLGSGLFDPRDTLGKNRGTCLHVLVSNELQRKTTLNTSLKMCDLLIEAGADPFRWFRSPKRLHGTCVDYGYREIDDAREARREEVGEVKKAFRLRKDRTYEKDPFKDQLRLVEYLANYASHWTRRKTGSRPRSTTHIFSPSERSVLRRPTRLLFSRSNRSREQSLYMTQSNDILRLKGKRKGTTVADFLKDEREMRRKSTFYAKPRKGLKLSFEASHLRMTEKDERKSPLKKQNLSDSKEDLASDSTDSKDKRKSASQTPTQKRRATSLTSEEGSETSQDYKGKSKPVSAKTKQKRKEASPHSEERSETLSEDTKGKRRPSEDIKGKGKQKRKVSTRGSEEDFESPSEDSKEKHRPTEKTKRKHKVATQGSEEDLESPPDDIKGKRRLTTAALKGKRRQSEDIKEIGKLEPEKTNKRKRKVSTRGSEEDLESPPDDIKGKRRPTSVDIKGKRRSQQAASKDTPASEKTKRKHKVATQGSEEDLESPPDDIKGKRRLTVAALKGKRRQSEDIKEKGKQEPEKTNKRKRKVSTRGSEEDFESPSEDSKEKRKPTEKTKRKHKVATQGSEEDLESPPDDIKGKRRLTVAALKGKRRQSEDIKEKGKLGPEKTNKRKRKVSTRGSEEDLESPPDDIKGKRRPTSVDIKGKRRSQQAASKGTPASEKTKRKHKAVSEEALGRPSDDKGKHGRESEGIKVKGVLVTHKNKEKRIIVEDSEGSHRAKEKGGHGLVKRSRSREITFVDYAEEGGRRREVVRKSLDMGPSTSEEDTVLEKRKPTIKAKAVVKPTKRESSTPEVFPEKLRQIFLRLYGNCPKMDINEFLMPYVVLRDGELYYKFRGKATKHKEQYSLV